MISGSQERAGRVVPRVAVPVHHLRAERRNREVKYLRLFLKIGHLVSLAFDLALLLAGQPGSCYLCLCETRLVEMFAFGRFLDDLGTFLRQIFLTAIEQ